MEEKFYAVDPEMLAGQSTQVEIESNESNEPEVTEVQTETTPTPPSTFDIEGLGSVTVDQIKEWQQGNLRQSDYTKKTQELAEARKQNERAIEFYKYMESNPHLVEGLRRIQAGMQVPQEVQQTTSYMDNPLAKEIEVLKSQLAEQQLNTTVNTLKQKYNDFNEVEVINEAQKRGLNDLEFVYKAIKAEKTPNIEELTNQIRTQILQELQQNKEATSTIIKGEGAKKQNSVNLTQQELYLAQQFGLTPEEYAKFK